MSLRVRSRVSTLILVLLWLATMTIGIARAQQSNFVAPVLIVNTGNVNIRTGPSVSYPVLLVATGGTQFPVLGVARDLVWYQINTDAGVGWVNVEFTVARGDFTNVPFADAPALVNTTTTTIGVNPVVNAPRLSIDTNRVIVNTGNLNVRSGPGAAYGIIAKVAGGVELAISGRAPDDVWFLVEGSFGLGWINSQYVIFRGDYRTVPIIEDAYRGGGIIVTANLTPNVVAGATQVPVPTQVPTQIGNAIAVLATVPPVVVAQDLGNHVIINTGNLNVRRGPGGSYEILAKVAGGTQLKIVGRAPDDVWFLIEGYFGLGWVNSQYVIFRGDYASVPIIADAYKGGGIIVSLTGATTTTTTNTVVITTTPQTVVITTTPQTVVVPAQPQTVIQPAANQGNRVIINTGNLNVRSGPGAGFSVVAVVPGGTELPVVGRAADGVWYLVQGGFGQGWINIEFAIFRGDGASVPVLDIRG
jgi:uncharacterized protein YraI